MGIKTKSKMKKEFQLEKGIDVESINIDVKANLLTVVYVEEKPVLKVGEWYICTSSNNNNPRLLLEDNKMVGFDNSCRWGKDSVSNPEMWKPADMTEVEKLLILEAEKRGFKKGVIFRTPVDNAEAIAISNKFHMFDGDLAMQKQGINKYFGIFNFESGKWAEIIPEKKPLYVNAYGTEFFEGDKYYWVGKIDLNIDSHNVRLNRCYEETKDFSEIMSKGECYEWIKDNICKLRP